MNDLPLACQCGDLLEALAAKTTTEFVAVAPFVKEDALSRVLAALGPDVRVRVTTRWRPDEIALGVSDIGVWDCLRERGNSELWLYSTLHAKYYRGDDDVLVGSANLTCKALGWSPSPNLEILVPSTADGMGMAGFEDALWGGSVPVDAAVVAAIRAASDAVRVERTPEASEGGANTRPVALQLSVASVGSWTPLLRSPENLYAAYTGHPLALSMATREGAEADLAVLDIPQGLSRKVFRPYVGAQLLQFPAILSVDAFVTQPQRFGAVRDFLARQKGMSRASREEQSLAWQTLMRWLRYFLPGRYVLSVPGHSEIFFRRPLDRGSLTVIPGND